MTSSSPARGATRRNSGSPQFTMRTTASLAALAFTAGLALVALPSFYLLERTEEDVTHDC